MKKTLAELEAKLGQPFTRGTVVSFGADNGNSSRSAFVTWPCYLAAGEAGTIGGAIGCGSACTAVNEIPYESDVFPDDNWVLEPCDIHEKTL